MSRPKDRISRPKDSISEFMRVMTSQMPATEVTERRSAVQFPEDVQKIVDEATERLRRQAAEKVAAAPTASIDPLVGDRIVAWLQVNGATSPRAVMAALGLGIEEATATFDRLERFGFIRRIDRDGAVLLDAVPG